MKVIDLANLSTYKTSLNKNQEPPETRADLSDFGKILSKTINETNELQLEADDLMEKMATGEVDNIHEVMVGVTKAEVALQFMLELRNKLMELYKEVMRMQV